MNLYNLIIKFIKFQIVKISMQKMHTQLNINFPRNSIYSTVDKSVHAELLLLEFTVALMNFIMCNPS